MLHDKARCHVANNVTLLLLLLLWEILEHPLFSTDMNPFEIFPRQKNLSKDADFMTFHLYSVQWGAPPLTSKIITLPVVSYGFQSFG